MVAPPARVRATPPLPKPEPLPLPEPEPLPEPAYTFPQREAADSILSEPDESEDEIFGSQNGNRMPIPRLPEISAYTPAAPLPVPLPAPLPPTLPHAPVVVVQPSPAPPLAPADPFAFDTAPAQPVKPITPPAPIPVLVPSPAAPLPPGLEATSLTPNPFTAMEVPLAPPPPPPTPAAVPTRPIPAPVAVPMPAPVAGGANPWAGLDEMAAAAAVAPALARPPQPIPVPVPQPVVVPIPQPVPVVESQPFDMPVHELPAEDPQPAKKPGRATRGGNKPTPEATSGGFPKSVVYGLAAYALLMTLLALYGLLFKSGDRLEPGHPLSTIPDNFGGFDPASRAKTSQFKFDVDAPLPPELRAGIGGKITVGQLEIEPQGVGIRTLSIKTLDAKGAEGLSNNRGKSLVLKLKVTNTSKELAVFPLDPAFNRKTRDKICTQLVVKDKHFYGGPVLWPFLGGMKRIFEEKQTDDAKPLAPGESREYVVCSDTDPQILKAVNASKEAVLWRVQVRRGLIEFKGKDVPVTAIIGVEFKPPVQEE